MKRIIVLALVVLVLGICSDAGAWPTSTSNPRYKPGTGGSGGGLEGGENIWFDEVGGSLYDGGMPSSIILTGFRIKYNSNSTNFGAYYQSPDTLNLVLSPNSDLSGSFTMKKFWTDGDEIRTYGATFYWDYIGSGTGTDHRWDWTATNFAVGSVPSSIGIMDSANLTLNFLVDGSSYQVTKSMQAAVPLPPSALLLAPGLLGLILVRRRWMK